MADKKISQIPNTSVLQDTDIFPFVRTTGTTKSNWTISWGNFKNLGTGSAGPGTAIGPSVYIAGQIIPGHTVVVMDASGTMMIADPQNPIHASTIIGITDASAVVGEQVSVMTNGDLITHSGWMFIPGYPVYVGANGTVSQTGVSTIFSKVVGMAVSPTSVVVSIQPAVFLN
jgi:hypothetical protein